MGCRGKLAFRVWVIMRILRALAAIILYPSHVYGMAHPALQMAALSANSNKALDVSQHEMLYFHH
jgi:hypothetical protein